MRIVMFGVAATCICLAVGVAAAPAPKATTTSIVLNVPSTQVTAFAGAEATTFPALGDWITFTVTLAKQVQNPRILINCYQNGELVYGEGGAYNQAFMLGGSASIWVYEHSTEPATCVATLFYWSNQGGGQKFVTLADTQFEAAGRSE